MVGTVVNSKNLHPLNTNVDTTTRFKGTVVHYNKGSGFGFIKPDKEGIVPNDKVMVYWKEIVSKDRWPFLHKDLNIEFNLSKFEKSNKSGCVIKAREVTLPGRKSIKLQEENDSKKDFILSQRTRFTGTVKFYNSKDGYGIVSLSPGYSGVDEIKSDLRVHRSEIVSGTDAPLLRRDLEIEFGIFKNPKGSYSCYKVTLPGGKPCTRDAVEGRKPAGNQTFQGELSFFSNKSGFGYIKPANISKFPAGVKTALNEATKRAQKRMEKSKKTNKDIEQLVYFRRSDVTSEKRGGRRGDKVSFKLYTDHHSAGAYEVQIS